MVWPLRNTLKLAVGPWVRWIGNTFSLSLPHISEMSRCSQTNQSMQAVPSINAQPFSRDLLKGGSCHHSQTGYRSLVEAHTHTKQLDVIFACSRLAPCLDMTWCVITFTMGGVCWVEICLVRDLRQSHGSPFAPAHEHSCCLYV